MKLDVRYNEGKFTRFNLVCENKDSKSPYIVNLLVHYDLIEILKLNLIMAEVKKNLNESPENKAPYQVVTLDELEKFCRKQACQSPRRNRIRACCGKNLTAFPIFKFSSLLIQ